MAHTAFDIFLLTLDGTRAAKKVLGHVQTANVGKFIDFTQTVDRALIKISSCVIFSTHVWIREEKNRTQVPFPRNFVWMILRQGHVHAERLLDELITLVYLACRLLSSEMISRLDLKRERAE